MLSDVAWMEMAKGCGRTGGAGTWVVDLGVAGVAAGSDGMRMGTGDGGRGRGWGPGGQGGAGGWVGG